MRQSCPKRCTARCRRGKPVAAPARETATPVPAASSRPVVVATPSSAFSRASLRLSGLGSSPPVSRVLLNFASCVRQRYDLFRSYNNRLPRPIRSPFSSIRARRDDAPLLPLSRGLLLASLPGHPSATVASISSPRSSTYRHAARHVCCPLICRSDATSVAKAGSASPASLRAFFFNIDVICASGPVTGNKGRASSSLGRLCVPRRDGQARDGLAKEATLANERTRK